MLQVWSLIIISAILVEAVTNALKPIWDETKRQISYSVLVSLAIGLIIAMTANLDIFSAAGIEINVPLVPQIFTGIIISRGANFVYDLLAKVQGKDTADKGEESK